jgi:hypothetical protein
MAPRHRPTFATLSSLPQSHFSTQFNAAPEHINDRPGAP